MTELLAHRIAEAARQNPSDPAVVTSREAVSYRDFWQSVTRTASALSGMRRVAVLPTSDVGSLTVVTAAMASGISVVLLHRHLLPEQLAHVLDVTRPGAVVAARSQHRRLAKLFVRQAEVLTPEELVGDGVFRTPLPGDELLVGVTSGTTGTPKLFVRDQASWASTLDRSDAMFVVGVGDRVSVPGVLDHTHFLYGALHSLTRGATVDLRDALSAADDGATHLYSVPTIAWDVVRGANGTFPQVREVLSSAARWPQSARDALRDVLPNASIVHFYGASELSFVSYDQGEESGVLFDGVEAEIRDGLVHVRSDMVFDGYLTAHGVVDGPVDGWMSVGDRGALRGNRIALFGRGTETIVRAGLNVELVPIEEALASMTGVAEAACIGVVNDRMGEEPCAAVVLGQLGSAERTPTMKEIWHHLRQVLPSPSIPTRILVVDSLPRTPRGKLDRQALGATFATVRTAPSTTNQTVSEPLS